MKCYDKVLIINGKAVRSPEQQVYKNMEDIEDLQKKIQVWYSSSVELATSSNTILRSNTNVPDDVESGILIDPVGNMFNITGGDETTLLITFYASIRGAQGPSGASSNDKGTYLTHSEPTLSDSVYTLSTGNIDNPSSDNIPVQVNDIVIYINSDDEPTSVFTVASISGTTLTLTLQGNYSKGKQTYKHNLCIKAGSRAYAYGIIENESPLLINDYNGLKQALTKFNSQNNLCPMTGLNRSSSSSSDVIAGVYLNPANNLMFIVYLKWDSGVEYILRVDQQINNTSSTVITDTLI